MNFAAKKIAILWLLVAFSATAQTNTSTTSNSPVSRIESGIETNPPMSSIELAEKLRGRCIEERRLICGKILRVFPTGLLIESGYTNLLREPLTKSWLAPATVTASQTKNLVESKEPGAICLGTVFLTDLPAGKPHQYDYVMITAYPRGDFSYASVGKVQKTVRAFSANLDKAVRANFSAEVQKRSPSQPGEAK
jgi:hypothetical protein